MLRLWCSCNNVTNHNPCLLLQSHSQFANPRPNPKPQSVSNPAIASRRRLKSLSLTRPEGAGLVKGVAATTSAIVLLGICISFPSLCLAAPPPPPPPPPISQPHSVQDEEEELAFEARKSKTFALSVPLRIVALRGSLPPSWAKDFIQSQGKRLRLQIKYLASLEKIFSDVSSSFQKPNVSPASAVAADIIGVGDSWLSLAIQKAIIQPISGAEYQDWFTGLSHKWKDWADLWRPELAGRISMIDSPREVVGMVLKYMGASYNTKNIELEVAGGRNAVKKNLTSLGKQVRLFDSMHYLKAFGVGDVWVAVGWSSDVIPVAKRMSGVAVVVPKSGASLWADLWAIPAASKLKTHQIGGRVRGPSPLIHQWIEFCLQAARAVPFKQEVIPGTVPSNLDSPAVEAAEEPRKGRPRLDTNLVCGAVLPEILEKCEFLEPLPEATLSDYEWLIAGIKNPGTGLNPKGQHHLLSVIQTFWLRVNSKLT